MGCLWLIGGVIVGGVFIWLGPYIALDLAEGLPFLWRAVILVGGVGIGFIIFCIGAAVWLEMGKDDYSGWGGPRRGGGGRRGGYGGRGGRR